MAYSFLAGARPARYHERCRATQWGIRGSFNETR